MCLPRLWGPSGTGARHLLIPIRGRGVVYLFSAETGEVLRRIQYPHADRDGSWDDFGYRLHYVERIDSDGRPGLLISASGFAGGVLLIDDQFDVAREWTWSPDKPRFGESLEVVESPEKGSAAKVVVGTANYFGGPTHGLVEVFALDREDPCRAYTLGPLPPAGEDEDQ